MHEPPEECDFDPEAPDFLRRPEVVRTAVLFWHLRIDVLLRDRGLTLHDICDALTALPALVYFEWHSTDVDCNKTRQRRHVPLTVEQAALDPGEE